MSKTSSLLWVDKHRPSTLDELTYHSEVTDRLRRLCAEGDIPHLLLYGPSGAGKRTRVACVLREIFGPSVEKRKVVHRTFKIGDTRTEVEVTTVTSSHHVEFNPSDSGNNDRLIVQELVKDMASYAPIDMGGGVSGPGGRAKSLKIIVLHEVDRMSRLAQQALRRTMEKYTRTCRIVMVAESVTKVLEPLRSRCLGIRVALPKESEVIDVLQLIAGREGVTLPGPLATRIANHSHRNLRRAVLQLEATRVTVGALSLPEGIDVMRGDWEYACFEAAILMVRQQSASQLVVIRKRFQELLGHAIPPDVILRRLVEEILKNVDDEIAPEICKVAARFDHHMCKGTKPIFHLEAFTARFMQMYSQFVKAQAAMID